MRARLTGGVLAALTAAVLAAGCSGSSTPPPAPSAARSAPVPPTASTPAAADTTAHNAADVAFVQGMLPHHTQAITMSSLAGDRAASPEVKDLAGEIERAQAPEIDQMKQLLAAWGAPAPQPGAQTMPGMPGMPGMPMGPMPMTGMMTDVQVQQLAASSGPAFDRAFLQMMIEHHTGAIQMARTEVAQGQNPQAEQLAQGIADQQQAEIGRMQTLLARI